MKLKFKYFLIWMIMAPLLLVNCDNDLDLRVLTDDVLPVMHWTAGWDNVAAEFEGNTERKMERVTSDKIETRLSSFWKDEDGTKKGKLYIKSEVDLEDVLIEVCANVSAFRGAEWQAVTGEGGDYTFQALSLKGGEAEELMKDKCVEKRRVTLEANTSEEIVISIPDFISKTNQENYKEVCLDISFPTDDGITISGDCIKLPPRFYDTFSIDEYDALMKEADPVEFFELEKLEMCDEYLNGAGTFYSDRPLRDENVRLIAQHIEGYLGAGHAFGRLQVADIIAENVLLWEGKLDFTETDEIQIEFSVPREVIQAKQLERGYEVQNMVKQIHGFEVVVNDLSISTPGPSREVIGFKSEDLNDINDRYLFVDPYEWRRLLHAQSAGLLEIAPAALPEADNLSDNRWHFGWPVAAMSGNTIVVVFARHDRHGEDMHKDWYIRSTDGGETWSEPKHLPKLWKWNNGANGMPTIGVNDYDEFVIVGERALISGDDGKSWEVYDTIEGLPGFGPMHGPGLRQHPEYGILAFNSRDWVQRSTDGGRTWEGVGWDAPGSPAAQESVIWGEGNIVLISREMDRSIATKDDRYFMHSQHVYNYEEDHSFSDLSFHSLRTNVRGNTVHHRANDTPGASYNPVTERIELLHAHRWGGGLGETGYDDSNPQHSLNLWSIDPDDLLSGGSRWQFDGTMLLRSGFAGPGPPRQDGLHPGAPVIDEKRNQEHIFIYAGLRRGPNGIIRVSRTLDTGRLRSYLLNEFATEWHFEKDDIVEDASGYQLTGKVQGNPSIVSGPSAYNETNAMQFDGDVRVYYPDGGDNDFFDFDEGGAFTIEMLVKPDDEGNATLMSKKEDGPGWSLELVDGNVRFVVQDEKGTKSRVEGGNIQAGKWSHLVVIRCPAEEFLRLYVDHQLLAMATDTTNNLSNDADMVAGGLSLSEDDPHFSGSMAKLKISRQAIHPDNFAQPNSTKETARIPVRNGLVAMLNASNVKTQDGKVLSWNDQSATGGANHAVIRSGSPKLVSSQMAGGRNVLRLSPDDVLEIPMNMSSFDGRRFTWFLAVKGKDSGGEGTIIQAGYDDLGNGFQSDAVWGTKQKDGGFISHTLNRDGDTKQVKGVTNDWSVISVTWDGPEGLRQYIDGNPAGQIDNTTADPFHHQGTYIGSIVDSSQGFDGYIAEVLIYDRVLGDAERTEVEKYLSKKYGL